MLDIPADYGATDPLVVGFILDFSQRHHDDSRRHVDIAKEQLIQVVTALESDDKVYLYMPDRMEVSPRSGMSVSDIAEYRLPVGFEPADAIRSTLSVVGLEDRDLRKYVFYLTDRAALKCDCVTESVLVRNNGCEVIVLGVGSRYDKSISGLPVRFLSIDPYSIKKTVCDRIAWKKCGRQSL